MSNNPRANPLAVIVDSNKRPALTPERRKEQTPNLENLHKFSFAHYFKPIYSEDICGADKGGDVLALVLTPKKVMVFMGDIEDHGLKAETHRTQIVAVIRDVLASAEGLSVSEVMANIEAGLKALPITDDMMMTGAYAVFDREQGTITFARAAHEKILYYNSESKKATVVEDISENHFFFGDLRGIKTNGNFTENKIENVQKSDKLVLVTDGLFELGIFTSVEEVLFKAFEESRGKSDSDLRSALTMALDAANLTPEKRRFIETNLLDAFVAGREQKWRTLTSQIGLMEKDAIKEKILRALEESGTGGAAEAKDAILSCLRNIIGQQNMQEILKHDDVAFVVVNVA